jgi:putative DNA primase/helicase
MSVDPVRSLGRSLDGRAIAPKKRANATAGSAVSGTCQTTEDELAMQFVKENPYLRWVERWHQWLTWNGKVWTEDSTLHVYDQVRSYLRGRRSSTATNSDRIGRATLVSAVEALCRSDRRIAATVDQWDTDQWLLNTPAGIVDLRTGRLTKHWPEAYCSMITKASPSIAGCPTWLSFLEDITEGDEQLTAFLQRLLGYCLTGQTIEHAFFFLHGGGGNGKSTFLDTVTGILGSYARNAPMETFVSSHADRHPTELAMLRGSRLVTAVETEEGRRWAESRIKSITGGDQITARFMRANFFTFTPHFKLLVIGNHKPRLVCVDEAMRRRLHLIPFEARFSGDRLVPDMPAKLRPEWSGILAWMIEGCLAWQIEGLNPPDRVKAATADYFNNQDTLAEWRSERCETGPGLWETPTRLFNSWRDYATDAGFPAGARAIFNDRMEAAGFRRSRTGSQRQWDGIKLRSDVEDFGRDRQWTGN